MPFFNNSLFARFSPVEIRDDLYHRLVGMTRTNEYKHQLSDGFYLFTCVLDNGLVLQYVIIN